MPIIKFQTSPKSNGNTGSCASAISYFTKEDKERDPSELGYGFFNSEKTGINPEEAKDIIEHKLWKKALRNDESKFFHVVISFSQEELEGKTDKQLIEIVQNNFAETYLKAGQRTEIDPLELSWCAKLEKTRKYKGDDEKVLKNEKKSGQLKEGDNRHIHILVARKTLNDKKISPLSNHFRGGKGKGAVKNGFDQDVFKADFEYIFDEETKHKRPLEDSVTTKLQKHRPDLFKSNLSNSLFDIALERLDKKIEEKKRLRFPKAQKLYFAIKSSFIKVIKKYGNRLKQKENSTKYVIIPPKAEENIAAEPTAKPIQRTEEVKDAQYFLNRAKELENKMLKASAEEMGEILKQIQQNTVDLTNFNKEKHLKNIAPGDNRPGINKNDQNSL